MLESECSIFAPVEPQWNCCYSLVSPVL